MTAHRLRIAATLCVLLAAFGCHKNTPTSQQITENTVAPAAPSPSNQLTQAWVTQSNALPFKVMYVYQAKNAAGEDLYCASADAQALGARPIEVELNTPSFKLWLRPGGASGAPSGDFTGAPCPAAFPPVGMSDGVLPTSAPAMLEFTLNGQTLTTNVRGQEITFQKVSGISDSLRASMAGGAHHSMHATVQGTIQHAPKIEGRLQVAAQADNTQTVQGTVASLLKVLLDNEGSSFELDTPQ